MLKINPCCSICQSFLLFLRPHYMYIRMYICIGHIFSIHSSVSRYLVCFHFLAIVNSAAMNNVQWTCRYLFEILLWILLDRYPGVGLLGHVVVLFLIFFGRSLLFSIWLDHFMYLSTVHEGSNFSPSLQTLGIFCSFYSDHPECELIPHCDFDLHFSDN